LLQAAAALLAEEAAAIDAINVYPVPDGDTGSNMSATFQAAVDRLEATVGGASLGDALDALGRGALYGARGNSGVILSQALRGFADGARDTTRLDGPAFVAGLEAASAAAYRAVSHPAEGTMLTVLRRAAEAARDAAARETGLSLERAVKPALAAAEAAEAATMDQLPALREAGVPDAGGEGICTLLRGFAAALSGGIPARSMVAAARPLAGSLDHSGEASGFCTEFVIEAEAKPLDLAAIRRAAEDANRSVVVVGDAAAVRVHVHTDSPEAVTAAAARFGRITRLKVDDMAAQHERMAETGRGATARASVLAISHGEGFAKVFKGLGAAVMDLGTIQKPAAGEIARAAEATGSADVIVLPNHRNVVLAAQQAAGLARCTLHVVPTKTLVEGVAAAVAFDASAGIEANVRAMAESFEATATIEVTVASTDRTADGVRVARGQAIGLVDGRLVAATTAPRDALVAALANAAPPAGALITIYGGDGVGAAELEAARAEIARRFPLAEVEALDGGQPLYTFIASVE